MIKATSKLGLGLVLLSAILAGCTAVNEKDEAVDVGTRGVQYPAAEQKAEPVEEIISSTFYFDFDQSALTDETKSLLRRHAEKLQQQPANIVLEGHADERGTREYNLALGERRAKAVRDFLLLQNAGVTSIEVISYGEEDPAVANADNEADWALNRRVVLKIN